MGYEKASALTGGRGRGKICLDIWNVFPEITPIFSTLSNSECVLTDEKKEKIEQCCFTIH